MLQPRPSIRVVRPFHLAQQLAREEVVKPSAVVTPGGYIGRQERRQLVQEALTETDVETLLKDHADECRDLFSIVDALRGEFLPRFFYRFPEFLQIEVCGRSALQFHRLWLLIELQDLGSIINLPC